MSDPELLNFFTERFDEIKDYLLLLHEVEMAAASGPPRIVGSASSISVSQQKILYSSVYLQLYNLVEATVSRCIDSIQAAAILNNRWKPGDLNDKLQREWVRAEVRTHTDMTPEHRLEAAVNACSHLISQLPISKFTIEVGGGGNWDDEAIEKISKRVGCKLSISRKARVAVKRPMRDDLGALKLVKDRRNSLAHGAISFVDCADGIAVSELEGMADAVGAYLREAIACFNSYIDLFDFLRPASKP